MAATRNDLLRLREPFAAADVEWRMGQAGEKNGRIWGKVLAYITNRAIMERLDTVVGPENWRNEFRASVGAKEGGVMCGLSILVERPNGTSEWITKWDGADETDIEATKGGISNAMKRAAVQWSIGRYLYDLEEGWAVVSENGRFNGKTKDGKWFKWDPPTLPAWALPATTPRAGAVATAPAPEPKMTAAQHTQIGALLTSLPEDGKIVVSVRKRVAAGLTKAAADECIAYLKANGATPPTLGGPVPAPGRVADALETVAPLALVAEGAR